MEENKEDPKIVLDTMTEIMYAEVILFNNYKKREIRPCKVFVLTSRNLYMVNIYKY